MRWYRILFALTVAGFIMPNFPALFGTVGLYARFVLLLALIPVTIAFLANSRLLIPLPLVAAIFLFLLYAVTTGFWSENPKLTMLKWAVYVCINLALLFGGSIAAERWPGNPFWVLKWTYIAMIVLSAISLVRGGGWFLGNFRGYSGNSNSLAASIMLTSPWLIYELKKRWPETRYRIGLLTLSCASLVIVLCTHSRAATGALLLLIAASASTVRISRKMLFVYLTVVLLIGIYLYRPSVYGVIYSTYVEKRSEDVFNSRAEQMQESWQAAKKGRLFGVGFGVSTDMARYWDSTLFGHSSREKGNSMLAIVEETGLIGFSLYLLEISGIYFSFRRFTASNNQESRFVYSIAVGFLLASTLHSAFEAWYLSTGPDVSVFWAVVGISIGALRNCSSVKSNEKLTHMETRARAHVLVSTFAPPK